ncbi:MAG: T9SS type A sorting domain-containing protein [Bacteroidetes bacterium]|nr:T9SS type A sorting domain-containing protein [Bacteroidota bacterium]
MRKAILLIFIGTVTSLAPLYAQWTQIGDDLDAEAAGDFFGYSVELSLEGSIMAVGADWNDGNGNKAGHVRVFENVYGVWTQIGDDIDGEAANDLSGRSLGLSSDGTIVAIGANRNNGGATGSGHVRVFENISGVWTQIGEDIDGEAAEDNSGIAISLSSDGSVVAIGANTNEGNGANSGHVRVFENISGVWTQIGDDIDGEASGDLSGSAISLSLDGTTIAIGAKGNDGNGSASGHVRVFENISGVWTQIGSDIDGEAPLDQSGQSVGLNFDGSIVAIGAIYNDNVNGSEVGHVRVFENISGVWTQIGDDIDGEATDDNFGWSLDLSFDGSILAVGAIRNDDNGNASGHLRVFKNLSGVWTQIGDDIDGEAAEDQSGNSISLNSEGSIVAIGAFKNDGNGIDSGHVRVYNDGILALGENVTNLSLFVYPNPVKNILYINNEINITEIEIYDILGKKIVVKEGSDKQINISRLPMGVYTVHIKTTKQTYTTKIIKN